MIDLDKLKQFNINDLKDLDPAEISTFLSEHKNVLINVVLIIGSLLIAGNMFNDQRSKEQKLHSLVVQGQQKIQVLKDRDAALQDLNNFKSSLPNKLNKFQLTSLISNYAKLYKVSIPSLSPADNKDMGQYDIINIRFNAVSDNFKNMMLFLRKIEMSNFPLRVDSWTGSEDQDGKIVFSIVISAVLIHS